MEFKAETKRLLEMMIHSVYSSKEVFLRELISNASDAIDKLKFAALTDKKLAIDNTTFEIRIERDKDNRILSVVDNGIGMTQEELIENIGTIAKSGTLEMLEKMQASKKSKEEMTELIGQFGVGFYSVFIVADKVAVATKKAGDSKATLWKSTGDGTYTISPHNKKDHGTEVILHLKPADPENGLDDFVDQYVIESTIKKYSDFIAYPIQMKTEREEIEKDDKGQPIKDGKKETIIEDKTLNSQKPIWTRPTNEVKQEEYNEFYKHISHDWTDPMKVIPFSAEGRVDYKALLFLPSKAPFDLFYQNYQFGLRLYAKKVLIQDNFEDLLPSYLRFVKGIVESPGLPLNISREMLQKDAHINFIKKGLTNKILSSLTEIFNKDKDTYKKFWTEFGQALKEGVSADFENKDKLLNLLLFSSSMVEEQTSLKDYVSRMKPNQKSIYYIVGESIGIVESSPQLEPFKEKGIEVLYLTDPIDSFIAPTLPEFEKKQFVAVSEGKEELIDEKDKESKEKELTDKKNEMNDFLKALHKPLEEYVKEVTITDTLVSAPVCLVNDKEGMGMNPYLEKLLKKSGQEVPTIKRIIQLNPQHTIVTKLYDSYKKDKNDPLIAEYAELLYTYATILEGGELKNAARVAESMSNLMMKGL